MPNPYAELMLLTGEFGFENEVANAVRPLYGIPLSHMA